MSQPTDAGDGAALATSERDPPLLDLPVGRGARLVALSHLREAEKARRRLEDGKDAEALHDLRVALRRLRSWLRAFRPVLEDPPRGLGALRTLADVTNPGRDAEVQLAWLRARRRRMPLRQRAAFDALLARITLRQAEAGARTKEALAGFDERLDSVRDRLGRYRHRIDVVQPRPEPRMAAVLATLVEGHARELESHLSSIRSADDVAESHAARIAGKRLRYLLEPLRDEIRAARPIVDELKGLQDALGELHDAHVLLGEVGGGALPRVGLAALRRLAEARIARAFADLQGRWLERRASKLIASARALAGRLEERSRLGIEIERKFLLRSVPPAARRAPSVTIDQGYVPGRRVAERIRRVRYGRRVDYVRSMKAGVGVVRMEVEEKTTRAIFEALWALTGSMRLRKRRYAVRSGDATWEIDEFLDRDLVLAEIELKSEDARVEIPDWLAPHVVREVSGELAYENHQIAMRRRPPRA